MSRRAWRGEHAVRRQRPRRGLRARLTRSFALVAVLTVILTTVLTVGATFRVLTQVGQVIGAPPGTASSGSAQSPGLWNEATRQQVLRDAGRSILRSAAQAAFLSALLATAVAALVTRQLTRPLALLADGAVRLQAGDRTVQLPVPGRRDELRDLTVTFNDLTASLARQEAWRRGLIADIAHDLRTPLSVMRSEIEAMQDGVQPVDEAGLARLHGEVLLLARLVTDLRTLSLAESGALSLRPQLLGAGETLRLLAQAYAARAAVAGATLSLHVSGPGPLLIQADPDRLRQALQNLLDNALRYAAPGRVDLGAWADARGTHLSVRDHGPGFAPDDLARAFERFYRADASRTRDPQGRASSGLGLAIARALVEAQGGQLTARNHPEGGAEFTLTLPREAALA